MPRRRSMVRLVMPLAALAPLACKTEVEKKMEAMAGTYVHEASAGPGAPSGQFLARREIVLRPNGRFVMTSSLEMRGAPRTSGADSGSYRVQGVTVSLHSEVERGVPMKYTLSGDTLFSAMAAMAKAVTGMDMEEEAFVKR